MEVVSQKVRKAGVGWGRQEETGGGKRKGQREGIFTFPRRVDESGWQDA